MKKQYGSLDIIKFLMAILVASRHMMQAFYSVNSQWYFPIVSWLSNITLPVFFLCSGFFLFSKLGESDKKRDQSIIFRYCKRIFSLYLLWSVLYLPINWINWYSGERNVGKGICVYVQSFLFSSPIVQLWYLPALVAACLLIWFFYSRNVTVRQLLLITGTLFLIGYVGDNWYFNQRLPACLQELLELYRRYFLTMRNGVFYGGFFVCLGLWFAKTKHKIPFWPAAFGAVLFTLLMYKEVRRFCNVNIVLCAAPAAFCLFAAAISIELKPRKIYASLRGASQWIYLSQTYFFFLFSWTARWNPVPFTERNIAIMILGAMILFSWRMVGIAGVKRFEWVGKMI